ncbi:glutathione S-transferase family protein [Pseudomonas sp. NPDC088368]|uniref:glutathione S-transferase family protein n=1 Tax=Pseudomonas sp. NPDC088368 TaxID=3364453 RepID=UPI0037FBDCDE
MHDMIELYGAQTGNCFRAAIALIEADIPFTVRHVDLRAGAHMQQPFMALNPAGKVPTLVDHNCTPSLVINQSNAIIQYADAKAPGTLAPSEIGPGRFRVFDRYFFFVTDVIATSHAAFFLKRVGLRDAAAPLDHRVVEQLLLAENFLTEAYMAGGAFSMADISAFTLAATIEDRLPWDKLPKLQQWFERMRARPSIEAGMRAFEV